jgi:hypothetical protein
LFINIPNNELNSSCRTLLNRYEYARHSDIAWFDPTFIACDRHVSKCVQILTLSESEIIGKCPATLTPPHEVLKWSLFLLTARNSPAGPTEKQEGLLVIKYYHFASSTVIAYHNCKEVNVSYCVPYATSHVTFSYHNHVIDDHKYS